MTLAEILKDEKRGMKIKNEKLGFYCQTKTTILHWMGKKKDHPIHGFLLGVKEMLDSDAWEPEE